MKQEHHLLVPSFPGQQSAPVWAPRSLPLVCVYFHLMRSVPGSQCSRSRGGQWQKRWLPLRPLKNHSIFFKIHHVRRCRNHTSILLQKIRESTPCGTYFSRSFLYGTAFYLLNRVVEDLPSYLEPRSPCSHSLNKPKAFKTYIYPKHSHKRMTRLGSVRHP